MSEITFLLLKDFNELKINDVFVWSHPIEYICLIREVRSSLGHFGVQVLYSSYRGKYSDPQNFTSLDIKQYQKIQNCFLCEDYSICCHLKEITETIIRQNKLKGKVYI